MAPPCKKFLLYLCVAAFRYLEFFPISKHCLVIPYHQDIIHIGQIAILQPEESESLQPFLKICELSDTFYRFFRLL